jgi:hypothetical protein
MDQQDNPPHDGNNNEEEKIEEAKAGNKSDEEEKDMVEDKEDEDIEVQGEKTIEQLKKKFFEESKSPIHDSDLFRGVWEVNNEDEKNEELEKYMYDSKEYRLYRKQDPNDDTKYKIYKHLKEGKLLTRIF